MKVGEIIKVGRKAKGMTQAKLADEVGVSSSTMGKIEQNKLNPADSVLKAIARVLDIKASELIEADRPKTASTSRSSASSSRSSSTSSRTSSTSGSNVRVTATEKKFLLAYRDATAKNRKYALNILKNDMPESMLVDIIKGMKSGDVASTLLDDILKLLTR